MKVVTIEAYENAYHMGYNQFSGMDTVSQLETDTFEFHHFTESAQWANTIAPRLRAMAGFSDNGHGTYTDENAVAYVEEPEDTPMDAEETNSQYIYNDLVDMYQNGAYDAFHEKDSDITRHL